ncbi:MAG TPA: hypothetical protein VGF97_14745 [Rhizomicrobium sp.]|jgi:hypothetical protein
MLVRAVFWIGVVAVLMPRAAEPGIGRQNDTGSIRAQLSDATNGTVQSAFACGVHQGSCSILPEILGMLKSSTLHSLAVVKADIEAQSHRTIPQTPQHAPG